jgi:hypothetical protein
MLGILTDFSLNMTSSLTEHLTQEASGAKVREAREASIPSPYLVAWAGWSK